jgi:hypothetical protein
VSDLFVGIGRAMFFVIGAGALIMSGTGLAGGASITDPVFPAGLALGILTVTAAAYTLAAARWQAVLVWLGVAAVLIGIGRFALLVFGDPDIGPDVYPYFLVPAAVLLFACGGVELGRVRAGALGA